MTQHIFARGMRSFVFVWFGQLLSFIGSGLTSFALGLWVYQHTGSVTQFAMISLCSVLPGILIAPLAGTLVDRLDRRAVLIASDSLEALSTLGIALLLMAGRLDIWHIYLVVAARSTFSVFRWPALSASVPLMVPHSQLGRANGMLQATQAVSQILPPVLAGVLIAAVQLSGIILIDVVTFVIAIVPLLLVRIPSPEPQDDAPAGGRPLLREVLYGWQYILARPGLFRLLIMFATINFFVGIIGVLVTPLVLSVASPAALGTVISVGGLGLLTGSVVMSVWGGPRRRIRGIFGFLLLDALCILIAGLRPSVLLFGIIAFGFFFGMALVNGCSYTIWQTRVAPGIQGRVFAAIQMIAGAAMPLGYLVAGPLADRVFEPLLAADGPLADTVGQIIGVGVGRGISLLFIILGTVILAVVAAGYLDPRLRLLEDELPDVVAEDQATSGVETHDLHTREDIAHA